MLERAIAIAVEAHKGQLDKGGAPYILHPLRVMLSLSTEEEQVVGVLHDVCEDSPAWSIERLRSEGFTDILLDAILSVTKREGECYQGFIRRAASNRIGRAVKLADLRDNSDLSRIGSPASSDFERLERYRNAIAFLTQNGV